ncbi:hypothetical protein MUK42_22211 [Musa troglodytarum]|uniref:Uncharacterized protein n=1 Tax=Musa troglodytarum TaxID=320322 RepID=A0A9E7ERM0_9LILI|nr:hypothetical protein MUK42_22211 [Musa troglodytarum]
MNPGNGHLLQKSIPFSSLPSSMSYKSCNASKYSTVTKSGGRMSVRRATCPAEESCHEGQPGEGQRRSAVARDVPHMPTTPRTAAWTSRAQKFLSRARGVHAPSVEQLIRIVPPFRSRPPTLDHIGSPCNISISIFTVRLLWTIKEYSKL